MSAEGLGSAASGAPDGGSNPYFASIHGDIYLWRIGELTAERALESIEEWMGSVEGMPQRGVAAAARR